MEPGDLVKCLCNLPMFTSIPGGENFKNDWVNPVIPDAPRNTTGIIIETVRNREVWIRWLANGYVGWSNSDYVAEVK